MAGGRGEGEGGGEEGLELLLPQLDGKRACQGVEQTWLALDLCLSLTEASDRIKEVTLGTPEWALC